MIKYNNSNINDWNYGSDNIVKVYRNNAVCYYKISDTPPTPPTPASKWIATYVGGTTSSAECDASSAITQNEINSTNLVSVEIGDCVTSIGSSAFYSATSLTSIDIPNSVTSIGNQAFRYCSGLTSIDIPNSVTSIDSQAFNRCTGLTSVSIGSGITSIGIGVFQNCSGLTSIIIEAATPPTLGTIAFNNTNDCPIYVPSGSVDTYKSASGWSSYASRITCVNPPVQSFKWKATYSDSSVTSAECDPSSAITNGEITLSNLVSVEIGDCVTSVGTSAFMGCSSLTSVVIPNSVTTIGNFVFSNCNGLTSITVHATTPPTLGVNPFNHTNDAPIYVPAASVETYKTSSYWSSYSSRIQAIPNS